MLNPLTSRLPAPLRQLLGSPTRPAGQAAEVPAHGHAHAPAPAPPCVGTIPTTHWRRARILVVGAMPVAALSGGLAAWRWYRDHPIPSSATGDAYSHAAGQHVGVILGTMAGSGLLPILLAAGSTAVRRLHERVCVLRGDRLQPQAQLERLVEHARAAPLTDAGLNACIQRIEALRKAHPSALDGTWVAAALARLAGAIPAQGCGCDPGTNPLQQERTLQYAIWDLQASGLISPEAYHRAVDAMRENLPAGFPSPDGNPELQPIEFITPPGFARGAVSRPA